MLARSTAPIWMDTSTGEECAEITAALGSSEEVATGRDLLAGMHTTSTPGKRTAETPPEPGADVAPASAVGGGYWSGAG